MASGEQTTPHFGSDYVAKQIELGSILWRLAERTGFFLSLDTLDKDDSKNYVPWPYGIAAATRSWIYGMYVERCKETGRRPFFLRAYAAFIEPGTGGIAPHLKTAAINVPNRVAMRALNAPLQVLSDGARKAGEPYVRGRLIQCLAVSDRFEYKAQVPDGAKAMWGILTSEPVRDMLFNRDHYSRARTYDKR